MAPRLRAEIHGPTAIRVTVPADSAGLVLAVPPRDPGAYRLTDGQGRAIPVAAVLPNTARELLLVPGDRLDPRRVYYVEVLGMKALARRDPLFRNLYSPKALGAVVEERGGEPAAPGEAGVRTTFRVFSPRADSVVLHLYDGKDDAPEAALARIPMERDGDGVWEASREGDLHGTWYDFTVHGPPDPGNWFYETHPVHISDPYARVNDDALGKSRVWRDGPPPAPVQGGRPAMEEVVAYEVHVQDFTDLLPVDPGEAGTLPAMVRPGLTNAHGEPIGLDYLESLGVNVVHLMPVQEFLHYPDEAWSQDLAASGRAEFAREMGIDRENYQWGYRTTHAFAVESRFRSRRPGPESDPGAERAQFKALVEAFHQRGMAVIIDLVPNHTGENMDGRHLLLNFNVLDLPYWYRTDEAVQHIGPFGNEVKTEERPMVQRWVVDQMKHWVEELGVDGFRIDLAGQIDKQTLLRARAELPEDVIIYGEPWIAPTDPDTRANPDWAWYKMDAPITFFQDDARNAFKGSPFEVEDPGWAGGNGEHRSGVMKALANDYVDETRTTRGISYLDIHDNWALADRYALEDYNGLKGVNLEAMRIAAGLLLTSAGPVVIHGGTEMLRSKGLAPLEEFEVEIAGGPIVFKGRDDTYNLRAPNRFVWDSLEPGSDALAMRDWWKGLIQLRMSEYGEVFRRETVPYGHYRWIPPDDTRQLGYVVGGRVLVLANAGPRAGEFWFSLPEGAWRQVADRSRVDLTGEGIGTPGVPTTLKGGDQVVKVPAGSFLVWVRD